MDSAPVQQRKPNLSAPKSQISSNEQQKLDQKAFKDYSVAPEMLETLVWPVWDWERHDLVKMMLISGVCRISNVSLFLVHVQSAESFVLQS